MNDIPQSIQVLHAYWSSLAGGVAPERAAFDVFEVRSLIPNILLCDLEFSPFRVRYRLSGTSVDEMTGVNLTGRYLDEFADGSYANSVEQISAHYEHVSRTGLPLFWSYAWSGFNPESILTWVGFFPLKRNGKIDQCLSIEDYGALYNPRRVARAPSSGDWATLSEETSFLIRRPSTSAVIF